VRHLRFPACVSHLTALQQLEVPLATFPELNALTALTALTKLYVANVTHSSTLLLFPALQHLSLGGTRNGALYPPLHTSSLASCTQLRCLSFCSFGLTGPGSLVASSMLQELDVQQCSLSSSGDEGPAAMSLWEVVFPGLGRLPHLTSLILGYVLPVPQQADVERMVACCSGLQRLQLNSVTDEQCRSLVQLTGLRDLDVFDPWPLSVAGLRLLAHVEQLTSLAFGVGFDSSKVSTVPLEQLSDTVVGGTLGIINKVRACFWVMEYCGVCRW